jgi:hypothetical protein
MMFIPVSHQKPTAYHSSHKLMGKFLEQLKVKGHKRKKKTKKIKYVLSKSSPKRRLEVWCSHTHRYLPLPLAAPMRSLDAGIMIHVHPISDN